MNLVIRVSVAAAVAVFLVPSRVNAREAPLSGAAQTSQDALSAVPVVVPPKPLYTRLDYPAGASSDGVVDLELTVSPTGTVQNAEAISGASPFTEQAQRAAMKWIFVPGYVNGVVRSVKIRYSVRFQLPPVASDGKSSWAGVEVPAGTQPTEVNDNGPSTGTETVEQSVTIEGRRLEQKFTLTAEQVRTLPGAFGDAFRATDVLPGLLPLATGIPYFYLRGAPPTNTGFWFDDVSVPMLFHVFAGPAVLHPGMLDSVDVYPGIYPARFGGATGGVVSGGGARQHFAPRAQVHVRAVDAGALIEVPFAEQKGSAVVAGRYSYAGPLVGWVNPNVKVGYWDYQSKVAYDWTPEDRVELLLLGSSDYFAQRPSEVNVADSPDAATGPNQSGFQTKLDLSFHKVDARWIHTIPEGTWTTGLTGGTEAVNVSNGAISSSVRSLRARTEWVTAWGKSAVSTVGLTGEVRDVRQRVDASYFAPPTPPPCGGVGGSGPPLDSCVDRTPIFPHLGEPDYELGVGNRLESQSALYASLVYDVTPRIQLTSGGRLDLFSSGHSVALGVDPRVRARFQIFPRLALLHGVGAAHQRPSFPVNVPSTTPTLKGGLQRAIQSDAGVEYAFGMATSVRLTGFYNLYDNFTDSQALPVAAQEHARSDGSAKGIEVLVSRSFSDAWGGLVSYTLSRSYRYRDRYAGVAAGDRSHVVNAAISYAPAAGWLVGLRGLFYSGVPATMPIETRSFRRTKPFWRLDWRVEKAWAWSDNRRFRVVLEVLNTTLNEEMVSLNCETGVDACRPERLGPVTIPNLGIEATF